MALSNLTVEISKLTYFVLLNPLYCNYPEAYVQNYFTVQGLTVLRSLEEFSYPFMVRGILPANHTMKDIDCTDLTTTSSKINSCIVIYQGTTCLPDDDRDQVYSLENFTYKMTEKSEPSAKMMSVVIQGFVNPYRATISHLKNFRYVNITQTAEFLNLYQWGGANDQTTFENFLFQNISNVNAITEVLGHKLVKYINLTFENSPLHKNELFHVYGGGDVEFHNTSVRDFESLGQMLTQAAEIRTTETGNVLFDGLLLENIQIAHTSFLLMTQYSRSVKINDCQFTNVAFNEDDGFFNIMNISSFEFTNSSFKNMIPLIEIESTSRLFNFESIHLQNAETFLIENITVEESVFTLFTISSIPDFTEEERFMTLQDISFLN